MVEAYISGIACELLGINPNLFSKALNASRVGSNFADGTGPRRLRTLLSARHTLDARCPGVFLVPSLLLAGSRPEEPCLTLVRSYCCSCPLSA